MRMIDQIRACKLPSNMMQFAARGALQVPAAENIEILVHLAEHNKVFGDLARMTLAGWDEKACLAAASDPKTPVEILEYFISPDNLRPKLLPALLQNPSVSEEEIAKLARSALRDTIEVMLKSPRVCASEIVIEVLRTNPYVKKEEAAELVRGLKAVEPTREHESSAVPEPLSVDDATTSSAETHTDVAQESHTDEIAEESLSEEPAVLVSAVEEDHAVISYIKDHADDIAAEGEKPFQAIGGIVELLGSEYFPVTHAAEVVPAAAPVQASAGSTSAAAAKPAVAAGSKAPERKNTLQKINSLDVKGRIQLALKGNKEERSILIRDGTKVVSLAVLEAPKLSDGEVEKFASQKNVLEAVLRQIPLKRRFMKNYIVVRNLVANPRTPLDLGLGLMKNLLIADLKNLSANKEVSETIRKLALKMYKQKLDAANKK
jgi:hypothetical protein